MMVQSPLELYTTVLGFKYYDLIWQLCSKFGLVYLPFLALILEGFTRPFEKPVGSGADLSLRMTFIGFISAVLVCYLAVAPAFTLDIKEIQYQPLCTDGAQTATPGHSGTTYDQQFQSLMVDSVKVPALLGLVMDVASGLTFTLSKTIPCTQDISQLMHSISLSRFSPGLQQSVQQFNAQCYLPAKAAFDSRHPAPSTYQSVMDKNGGQADLTWMGSHVLQTLYYKGIRAQQPTPPFPYGTFPSPQVDQNVKDGQQAGVPQYGYPSCEQWWSDPQYGLEHQIVNEVDNNTPHNSYLAELPLHDRVNRWLTAMGHALGGQGNADDVVARGALYDSSTMGESSLGETDTSLIAGGGSSLTGLGMMLGQLKDSVMKAPFERQTAKDLLPIIQAVFIFVLLMFYPLVCIFGNYSPKVMVSLLFLVFSLIFTSAIWQLLFSFQASVNDSISYVNLTNPTQKPMFNNFFTICYYAVPLLFNSLCAAGGYMLGGIASGLSAPMTEMTKSVNSSSGGNNGSDMAEKGVGKAVTTAAETTSQMPLL